MIDDSPIPCGRCGAMDAVCDGSGYQKTATGAAPCPNYKGQLGARRLEAARLPARFREACFEDVRTDLPGKAILEAHVALSRRYVAFLTAHHQGGPKIVPSLLLTGPAGSGKTLLASIVAREAALAGLDVRFAEVTALIARLTNLIDSRAETADDVLGPLLGADLLILDEIGARRPTAYVADVLYLLVNGRYNDMAPTIYTTNLSFPGDETAPRDRWLGSVVGERLASRLHECRVLDFRGVEDFRKRKASGRPSPGA